MKGGELVKDRIKRVRESNGLNLTRFADALNTSVAAVSRYESGERELQLVESQEYYAEPRMQFEVTQVR
jgi:transcriptional regulator with XRE-family HTH domain